MDIMLNTTFIRNIRDYGINVDQIGTVIFIMVALDKGRIDLLDALDDENKERRLVMLYQTLTRKGFIELTNETDLVHYQIAQKGYDFLNYIYSELGNTEIVSSEVEANTAITQIKSGNVEDWILEYVNIFPKGIVEGKKLRLSSAECIPKMKSFMKKYPYDKDTILEATKLYIRDENGGQQHTRNSKYFIEKHDPEKGYISDLLTYCERVIEERTNPEVNTHEHVI